MAEAVAQIVVNSLENAGVKLVFGIPGAKIDAIFNCLLDHPRIKLIVCRHEQNAAMMAGAVGRLTGTPGVCIATSGPGASNLATGLVTATTEGDPVVAIIGSVPRSMNAKRTHQSLKALQLLDPTAKHVASIDVADQAAEVILQGFRAASDYPRGASVLSLPIDVASESSKVLPFSTEAFSPSPHGPAPISRIDQVAEMINKAKLPVLFLGLRAGEREVVDTVRDLLSKAALPTVETFQAAGAVPKDLVHLFYGRVGLFRNQPGDRLLAASDLILCVGYDPVEYDASAWNPGGKLNIIHIDHFIGDYSADYQPKFELLGSIAETIKALDTKIDRNFKHDTPFLISLKEEFMAWRAREETKRTSGKIHPLHFLSILQDHVSADTTICCDVGTVYIYVMRYFLCYEPRRLLCSDGQQTLGVGLPWAIAASLTQDVPCSQKVISMSGDGGFMFSSQELSTAVQQGCNITHFIWNDEAYNMVEFQEELKYNRSSGVRLGGVDFAKFAEAFGARGMRIRDASELQQGIREALNYDGVTIVDVAVDYEHNNELAQHIIKSEWD